MEPEQIAKDFMDMREYVRGRMVDKKAFTEFVQSLATVWHKLRTAINERVTAVENAVESKTSALKRYVDTSNSDITEKIDTLDSKTAQDIRSLRTDLHTKLREMDGYMLQIREDMPEEYDDVELRGAIESVRLSIPILETKKEVWDRFDKLEKKIRSIEDTKPSIVRQVFGGGRPVHVPMVDDFSGLTDGNTKTFYLTKQPRSLTTMKGWGSDFPYILRVNIDFTVAGKLLTLTDQVQAPTQGATLVFEYYI